MPFVLFKIVSLLFCEEWWQLAGRSRQILILWPFWCLLKNPSLFYFKLFLDYFLEPTCRSKSPYLHGELWMIVGKNKTAVLPCPFQAFCWDRLRVTATFWTIYIYFFNMLGHLSVSDQVYACNNASFSTQTLVTRIPFLFFIHLRSYLAITL